MKDKLDLFFVWSANALAWILNIKPEWFGNNFLDIKIFFGEAFFYLKEILGFLAFAAAAALSLMRALVYYKENKHKLRFWKK